jgi:tryptophan-rich sensory protein
MALCALLGVVNFASIASDDWYSSLAKPGWTPKAWVFPLVWLALYASMAVAAARVTRHRHPDVPIALSYFAVQLALSAVWLPALRHAHALAVALIASALLWLASAATLWLFREIDRGAGLLLAPALAWATFLAALAVEVWRLN